MLRPVAIGLWSLALALLVLAGTPNYAATQEPNLRARNPAQSFLGQWPQNEVPHTISQQTTTRFWNGQDMADDPCGGCLPVTGNVLTYPIEGKQPRELFVPSLIWTNTGLFTAGGPFADQGGWLAQMMWADTENDVQLGLDPANTGSITSLFPDDYLTVSNQVRSVGQLKAPYSADRE